MGTGSLVFSLPHFIADPYFSLDEVIKFADNSTSNIDLCFEDTTTKEEIRSKLTHYKWFFYIGQFLNGVGATPLTTLATPLLDDTVKKVSAPIYIGIFQTFFVVGPAMGYILGGSFLGIYVDFSFWNLDIPLKTSGETWVGAWWVGFVISWIMSWLCALAIFCYPALLPINTASFNNISPNIQSGSDSNRNFNGTTQAYPNLPTNRSRNILVEIPLSILSLLKNPTYLFISIAEAFDALSITGLSTFIPKFVEQQYGYTAGNAALLFGIIVTPSGGLGTFGGGFVIKHFKLKRIQALKMYIICQSLTIPFCLAMLMYCKSPQRPGVNVPYKKVFPESTTAIFLNSTCNANCGSCGILNEFMPVCGSDNKQYFNPCYAGCTNVKIVNGNKRYLNCGCIEGYKKIATVDSCNNGCNYFGYFATLSFVIIVLTFMAQMPGIVATLRFVRPEERALGNGIQSIIIRYTYIPALCFYY